MNKFNLLTAALMASAVLLNWSGSHQPASAYRAMFRGQNGAGSAYANQGTYGSRVGGRFLGPNAGAGFRAGQYTGANGGTAQGASGFGYKTGVGAYHQGGWSGQAANGASGYGSSKTQYNAQTGQGTSTSQIQATNASGQNYGYTGNTNYTKGAGSQSVIQTDNNGTYDVNLARGQKPVVTSVPSN